MQEHIVDIINERFSNLAGKDVVIYGTGQIAALLLNIKSKLVFNIVGVMDRIITEGNFKGVKVINTDDVYDITKIIIIAAASKNYSVIYDRISYLEEKGVDIYFFDGEQRNINNETAASDYFIRTREKLVTLIDSHDIISFDVFDTLIMRRCLYPGEIFSIIESHRQEPGFAEKRKKAGEDASAEFGDHRTIYDIYSCMGMERSDTMVEIELEKEMLVSRSDMIPYYKYALGQGKIVILTSDMYLPEFVMIDLLSKCGISDYHKIYVSCDIGKTKRDNSIWKDICKEYPTGNMLHIGDNILADNVQYSGVTPYIIKSTVEIADILGFGGALKASKDSNDYVTIGTVLARLLEHDLTDVNYKGKISIHNMQSIGYCFIAPITLGYVSWLAKTASINNEKILYFCARDTYLLIQIYNKLYKQYNAPHAKYLYISKRVLCGALAKSLSGVKTCLEYYYDAIDSSTTVREALFRLFGWKLPDDGFTSLLVKQTDWKTVYNKVKDDYYEQAHYISKKEYDCFIRYLKKNKIDEQQIAIVDFIAGQSVELSREFFKGNVYLFSMTAYTEQPYIPDNRCFRWKKEITSYITKTRRSRLYETFLEAVYSSTEGTCLFFNENGDPVLNEERKNNLCKEGICEGIKDYCDDINAASSFDVSKSIYKALFSGQYAIDDLVISMEPTNYILNKGE